MEPGPDKIAIGVLFSTRGSYASLGREGLHGALTAIAEINADAVHPFKLVAATRNPAGNTEAWLATIPEPSTLFFASIPLLMLLTIYCRRALAIRESPLATEPITLRRDEV